MSEKKHTPTYTVEFRERGVRLYREQRSEYSSDNAAFKAIAPKLALYTTHRTMKLLRVFEGKSLPKRLWLFPVDG